MDCVSVVLVCVLLTSNVFVLLCCIVLLYGVRVFVCCACVYEHVCVPCLCFEFGALMSVCFVFVINCVMLYDLVLCCL